MIRAALFDFDGTIANTDAVHHACWNTVLQSFGASIDEVFYAEHCSGALSAHIAEQILSAHPAVPLSATELAHQKDALYESRAANGSVALMPGMREMLDFLAEHAIRTGIVTGAPLTAIIQTLKDNAISDAFEVCITREDVSRGKPAPDGYRLALSRLGLQAEHSVSFEDTASGVSSAKAAGMHSIAIANNYTRSHDFTKADHSCDDMLAAIEVLKTILNG